MSLFGLKLGIHEEELSRRAGELWRDGRFDFLELYASTPIDSSTVALWDWYDGKLVVHAPHSGSGFNFARRDMKESNFQTLHDLSAITERLAPALVVFHPGLDGPMEEGLGQLAEMRRLYPELHRIMLLENKPRLGIHGENCLGASPEEMRTLLESVGCGLCLDVRHAFAYASWAGLDWRGVIDDFVSCNPLLWHAADGLVADCVDSHLHIGAGDMPWREIAEWWSAADMITLECVKRPEALLADFLDDLAVLRRVMEPTGMP